MTSGFGSQGLSVEGAATVQGGHGDPQTWVASPHVTSGGHAALCALVSLSVK